jgi:hypothetical protein
VSSDAPAPVYRTGWLWGVLALFLLVGTVASAFVVYGFLGVLGGNLFPSLPIAVVAGFVAVVALLILTGMLYRIDRLRGTPHREVRLFE